MDSSDFSFSWPPAELERNAEHIWQIAQAFSNWSPVLLDMEDMAVEDDSVGEERKTYGDKDSIPYRRSQCQIMSQLTIHDCDKPQYPGDASVLDDYGQACLRGFFAQATWQARVGVVHTGALGRSLSLQECWGKDCEVISQSQLDKFLKRSARKFEKPRNGDYSTSTSSILVGARGYVGRGFGVALKTCETCYEEKASLADASKKLHNVLPNFGEFLNSHYFFQLMLYNGAYMNHGPGTCEVMKYFAQWNVEASPMPRALLSKKNTLKFFNAMRSNGATKPIKPKDLPEERISFHTVSGHGSFSDGMDFVNTVLRRLERFRQQKVSLDVLVSVGSHVFRWDNVLVQACMAEKVRQDQVSLP